MNAMALIPPSAQPGISPSRGEVGCGARIRTQFPHRKGRCHEMTEGGELALRHHLGVLPC